MRHFRINLPNRCCRLFSRVTHRAFEGGQAANRKGYAAMTRKTYCGNLLWQSGLTLLVARELGRPVPAQAGGQESDGAVVAAKRVMTVERRVPACMAFQTETAECDWPARPITRKGERPCIQKVIMVGATHLARPWEKLAAKADAGTRVRASEITEGHVRVGMRLREEMRGRRIGRGRRAACHVGRTRGIRI